MAKGWSTRNGLLSRIRAKTPETSKEDTKEPRVTERKYDALVERLARRVSEESKNEIERSDALRAFEEAFLKELGEEDVKTKAKKESSDFPQGLLRAVEKMRLEGHYDKSVDIREVLERVMKKNSDTEK